MLRRKKTGQSTAEYAIVIGLVLSAALAMQVYVKRGIQGKVKDASDAQVLTTNGLDFGVNSIKSGQYEPPYATTTEMVTTRDLSETAVVSLNGGVSRNIDGEQLNTMKGQQEILPWN